MSEASINLLQELVKNEIDRLQGKMEIEFKIFTDLGVKNLDDTQYKQKLTELTNLLNELNPVSK
jgi:hypothetical protein